MYFYVGTPRNFQRVTGIPMLRRWTPGKIWGLAIGSLGAARRRVGLRASSWTPRRADRGAPDRYTRRAQRAARAALVRPEWRRDKRRVRASSHLGARGLGKARRLGKARARPGRRGGGARRATSRHSVRSAHKCFTVLLFERKNLQKNE
jgi:hypothetical protein